MSEHDRLARAFESLRAATEAGLRPPGAADAVVRHRKRRARRAAAVSIAVVAALSMALQTSANNGRRDPGPAASPTASPSTSPSPSVSPSPQATVTSASPESTSSAAGSRTAKPPPDYDCQRRVGMVINSTQGGYIVGQIGAAGASSWTLCETARIGIFWVVYSYAASGPRPRAKSGMQYVTMDSPTVFIPLLPSDPCRGDVWVIAQGLTIPATLPAGTTRQTLHQYFSSVGDSAIADGFADVCWPSPAASPSP